MSAPPIPYSRQTTFTQFATEQFPTTGQGLEAEFNKVAQSISTTQSRLAEIQRDDGALRNLSVTLDTLAYEVRIALGGDISLDTIQQLVGQFGNAVSLTSFKTVGNTWGEAWNDWVAYINSSALPGLIPAGEYDITGATTCVINSRITIYGAGKGMSRLIAFDSPVLFAPGTMTSFVFKGVSTNGISLMSGNLGGNVERIEVDDWSYVCTTQRPFFVNSVFEDDGFVVDDIQLTGINGRGGICGVQCFTAFRRANVDRIDVGGIVVPDNDAYYSNASGTLNMLSRGYNGGFIIGYDNENAVPICEYLSVGTIVVDGVNDQRTKRGSGSTANCDGVKFHGCRNVTFNSITVKNVTSHYKSDTSGFYHKVINMAGGSLLIVDAGHHEASWTVKGRYRSDSGPSVNSRGWNIDINSVSIINTQGFVGRPAFYFSTEDIRVGTFYIEGCGGDVENPYSPGTRMSGTGGVGYCTASNPLSRLSIGELQLVNCKVGSIVTNRLVRLDAFKDIRIGRVLIDGADNGGLFSTQAAGSEQNTRAISVMASQAMSRLEIGSISVRNCVNNGKTMTALALEGGSTIDIATIGSIVTDNTVTTGVLTTGTPITLLQIGQGDLSKAGTSINYSSSRPVEVDIGTVKGVSFQLVRNGDASSGTTNWINNSGTLTVNGGRFRLARSGGSQGRAYQPISCEVGKFYAVSALLSPGSQAPSNPSAVVGVGVSPGTITGAISQDSVTGSERVINLVFKATQTEHYIIFTTNPSSSGATDGDYIEFDNVIAYEIGR